MHISKMSADPVLPILHPLSHIGSTALSGRPRLLRRESFDCRELGKRVSKFVKAPGPASKWRPFAWSFFGYLFLVSSTLLGRCSHDTSSQQLLSSASSPAPFSAALFQTTSGDHVAGSNSTFVPLAAEQPGHSKPDLLVDSDTSSPQLLSSASSPAPFSAALFQTTSGDHVAGSSSTFVPLSAEQPRHSKPDLLVDSDSKRVVLDVQADPAQARVQRAILGEKGKSRSPPLLYIHRAFSHLTGEAATTSSDTKLENAPPMRTYPDTAEPEMKRLGVQARAKQSTNPRSIVQEANALPLRTYTYGNIHQTAYYFADVIIGTPPVQRQSLILDTGSSVVGFPCTTCRSCGAHIDPPFDCAASSSCKRLQCTTSCTHCDSKQKRCAYRVSYMEGSSLQGFWHEDFIHVLKPPRTIMKNNERVYDIKTQMTQARKNMQFRPSNTFVPSPLLSSPTVANFGCHMEETALFVNQKASGIWGLEIWSQFGPSTYMTRTLLGNTLAAHQLRGSSSSARSGASVPPHAKKPAPVFALCLAEHGGAFAVGEAHKELHTSKPVTTCFIPDQESYSVYISAIAVGEQNIPLLPAKNRPPSANLPPAFVSAAFETLRPSATPSNMRSSGNDTYFEVLLDSGTTMSYFPTNIYTRIVTAIERYAEQHNRLSSNTRRLGATSPEPERGKAYAPEGKQAGTLSPLYAIDDERDNAVVAGEIDANEVSGVEAEEGQLYMPRGEMQIAQRKENESIQEEDSEDTIDIVLNPSATQLLQHSKAKSVGLRRAVPREAEDSVPQRRPHKGHSSVEATTDYSQRSPAVQEVAATENDGHDRLIRRRVASRSQDTQESQRQPAAASHQPQTSALLPGSSAGKGETAAKCADKEKNEQTIFSLSRSGQAAKEGGPKPVLVARRSNLSYGRGRTEFRSGKAALLFLGNNLHSAFRGRRMRFSSIWEKLRRRRGRLVALGEEVRDSEAEIVGDILSSHQIDDEEAYMLLPPSASPRQSQAVKVESAEGEMCFYLPKGRSDLKYFPDIWIRFVQTSPQRETSNSTTTSKTDDYTVDATPARNWGGTAGERENVIRDASTGWLRWAPASYLYTKGNDHYRCVAVSDDPNSNTTGVLGSSFFIGHDVIFDVENHVVTFAEANCPRIKLKDRPRDLPL